MKSDATLKNKLPYIITNPEKNFMLNKLDKIICIGEPSFSERFENFSETEFEETKKKNENSESDSSFEYMTSNGNKRRNGMDKRKKSENKEINKADELENLNEEELLETGGAIKNAKEILGDKPIFTLNTDTILRANYNIFKDMIKEWNPEKMDFLLLLQPYDRAVGYTGRHGDFEMDRYGRLSRPDIEGNYSFMYTGLSILKPATIAKNPLKIFSLKEYYLNSQKIFGIKAKDARWYHASRPEDLVEIEIDMLAYGNI